MKIPIEDNHKMENAQKKTDGKFKLGKLKKRKTGESQDDRYPDRSIPQSERSQGTPPIEYTSH